MFELFIALGVFIALVGFVLAGRYWDALLLLRWGWTLLALGLGLGVPTGFIYHVKLLRFLRRRDAPTKGWWIDPRPLHQYLSSEELKNCVPWFYIGGAGFVLCVGGCICLLLALLSGWFG